MSGKTLMPVVAGEAVPARGNRREARRGLEMPPSVLEFHSPSAAMANVAALPGARSTVWVVGALVVSCFTLAWLIPVDRVVSATGKVVSVAPTEVVQPLETSIVRSIDVQEGQVVHKGDVLAQLDPTDTTANVGASTQQSGSYRAEVDRLTAEAAGKPYQPSATDQATQVQAAIFAQRASEHNFRLQNLQQKIEGFQALVQRDEQDTEFYKQRLAIASNVAGMRAELQRDAVGSKLNTLQAQDAQVEATRSLGAALRSAQQDRAQLQGALAERDGYDQEWRSKISQDLTEASRRLSASQEELAKAELRSRLVVLRAGQDGVVQTVAKVSVGSVLASGDQFFTLVPLNSPLEIEVSVPASESGYVHVGDKVSVKFETFPSTRYGGANGTMRLISADSFTAGDQQGQRRGGGGGGQGQEGGAAFYRGKVTIDQVTLHDTPKGFHIIPGMPVTADIEIGKRTVAGYLLGSILPVAHEGMREP